MISHSPNAPVNEFAPQPPGCCDRCGFKYPLARLDYQMAWAGDSLINTHLRVCPTCMDRPQPNGRRTVYVGGDPKPLRDPRPFHYAQQAGVPPQQFVLDDPNSDELDRDVLGPADVLILNTGTLGNKVA